MENQEKGFLLVELMAAIVILSIVGLALANSAYTALRVERMAEIGNHAQNIAVTRVERLAGVPFVALDTTYNETATPVGSVGTSLIFARSTAITINGDGSKTVDVTVTATSPLLPHAVGITSRFAPWELQ